MRRVLAQRGKARSGTLPDINRWLKASNRRIVCILFTAQVNGRRRRQQRTNVFIETVLDAAKPVTFPEGTPRYWVHIDAVAADLVHEGYPIPVRFHTGGGSHGAAS